MNGFWFIICWIFGFGIVFSFISPYRTEVVLGQTKTRYSWLGAIILIFPIVYWATIRSDIFGDTITYYGTLTNLPIDDFIRFISGDLKDKGFYVLTYLLKILGNGNRYFYFGAIAIFQGICIICAYRKYSTDYWLSVLLFALSTDYLAWMFNGMRQFIAVSMLFACIELIIRKKYLPLILVILLASTIHQSALIMLPVIFIVQGKPFNKLVILFSGILVLSILLLEQTTELVTDILSSTQYSDLAANMDIILAEDDGTNILRVLVYAVPTILAVIWRKNIWAEDDPIINLSVNMSVISTGFYILSIFTSGIYVGRIPIYFSLYNYILLPWEIRNMFTRDSQRIVRFVLCAAYLFFYYYQVHVTWGLM